MHPSVGPTQDMQVDNHSSASIVHLEGMTFEQFHFVEEEVKQSLVKNEGEIRDALKIDVKKPKM